MRGFPIVMLAASCLAWGCRDEPEPPVAQQTADPAPTASSERLVGYDLRRLRPRNEEPLDAMFERLRKRAVADGKTVAVLFSAGWCEPCQRLDLEFGRRHPEDAIGDVRIFELKEEDWEAVTRMDEFNALRKRWYPQASVYPVFVVLDEQAAKVEEMKDAIARLEQQGVEPTLANWFRGLRAS